jgi:hypothetical protein
MKLKYVRHQKKGFFLFPDSDRVWHSHVGSFLGREELVSAGFVRFKSGVPECFGASESLRLGGAPDDTDSLRAWLGISENAALTNTPLPDHES